jgi:predicted nucleic acid-binding protein
MILVLDASVALKWFFRWREDEPDVERALAVLHRVDSGRNRILEPPHFLAEMATTLARKQPAAARRDFRDLREMVWKTIEESGLYEKAVELTNRLDHHLFDTLYHAAAVVTPKAKLITADVRYYRKAKQIGQIIPLTDFEHDE